MQTKLIGLIMLDVILISMAWVLPIFEPTLFGIVEWTMIVLTSITLLTVLTIDKKGDMYKKLLEDREDRPVWWSFYDILTDIMFIVSWGLNGAPGLALLYMVHKTMIMIKMPDYYKVNKDN